MDPIFIFLSVALVILVVAFLLSRIFRREIEHDKMLDRAEQGDLNGRRRDSEAHATWIGINRASDDDIRPDI